MNWTEKLLGGTRGQILARLRRAKRSINELAEGLGISDNAVRGHISALQRDGMVETAGVERLTGGKPAQLYRITPEAEELFPKAYAFVLGEVLRVIEERDGAEATLEVLQAVGTRAAAARRVAALDPEARVAAAADALRALGGDVEIERTESGWLLRGYGCLLTAAVVEHPRVCALAQSLIAELTGQPVAERCERGERPRCAFLVAEGGSGEQRGGSAHPASGGETR